MTNIPSPPPLPSSSNATISSTIRSLKPSSASPPPRSKSPDEGFFGNLFDEYNELDNRSVSFYSPYFPIEKADQLIKDCQKGCFQILNAASSPEKLFKIGIEVQKLQKKISPLKGKYWSSSKNEQKKFESKYHELDAMQTKLTFFLAQLQLYIYKIATQNKKMRK